MHTSLFHAVMFSVSAVAHSSVTQSHTTLLVHSYIFTLVICSGRILPSSDPTIAYMCELHTFIDVTSPHGAESLRS